MTVYVAFPLTGAEKALIDATRQQEDQWFWAQDIPHDKQFEAFRSAEVVFGNVDPSWVSNSPALRWLQLYSAGFDPYLDLDWNWALKHIKVTNLRGFFGQPVAETAVGGILALYRKLDELALLQHQKNWKGAGLRPLMRLLHKKKVIIAGAGSIGQTIRDLLSGFQCNTTIISRSQPPYLTDLDTLLPHADIVITALPDTNETKNLFNESRFKLFKPDAVFINVGRGAAVDEPALVNALQQQQIAGAVLDVTNQEPLPVESPLWDCSNILLTQHTGGGYQEENADKVRFFISNLQLYRNGDSLQNIVDFSKGY